MVEPQMGGRGMNLCYAPRTDAVLSAGYSRNRILVWGSNGGSDGTTNGLEIVRKNGKAEAYAYAGGVSISPGDEVRVFTANGGGWGARPPPAARQ